MATTANAADLAGKAELQNLRYSLGSGMVRIVLDLSKKVEFVEGYAENPSRLVLSLKNTWIDVKKMKKDIALSSTAANSIKVVQYDPSTVRVVVETMADIKIFWLDGGPSGQRLVVDVGNAATFKENAELNKSKDSKPVEVKPADDKKSDDKSNDKSDDKKSDDTKSDDKSDDKKSDIKSDDSDEEFDNSEYNEAFAKELEKRKKELDKREKELEKREREIEKRELKEQERQKAAELKAAKERAKKELDKKSKDDKKKKTETKPKVDKDLKDITALKGKTIVIDPGHGGNDAGAIGPTGVTEKSVTLRVGLRLAELLREEGATVIMTRETDKTVAAAGAKASDIEELQARCDVANKSNCDIFVSIHADSFTNPKSRGTTGYYYENSTDDASRKLADAIRRNLVEQIGTPSRGTKPCNFYVVRHTDMPATLVELAFISNPEEEAILDSEEGIEGAAQGILDGIEDYFG